MTLDTLRLTLTTDNISYDITMIQEVQMPQTKEAFSIAPPGQGPRDNVLLGVSGMQADIEITFFMHDDGTDKANGTAAGEGFDGDTVVTIAEQRRWLTEHIHDESFTAAWELDHLNGDEYDDEEVFLERIDTRPFDRSSPLWRETRIALRLGESI